jgi:hypothetical protein
MAKKKNQPPATDSLPGSPEPIDADSKYSDEQKPESKDIALTKGDAEQFEVAFGDLESKGLRTTSATFRIYIPAIDKLLSIFPNLINSPIIKRLLEHRMEIQREREHTRRSQVLAKAEIDLAIAKRIETANSVEIEEYYDASVKGHAGASKDDKGAQIGIGGEGQRVVKRKIVLEGTTIDRQQVNQDRAPAIEPAAPKLGGEDKMSLPAPQGEPAQETVDERKLVS